MFLGAEETEQEPGKIEEKIRMSTLSGRSALHSHFHSDF